MKNRIIEIREKSHLSQAAFAEQLGLSRNFIGLIENGKRNLSDRTIKDICQKFGYSELWLRTGQGDPKADVLPLDENALLAARYENPDTALYRAYLRILKVYDQYPDDKKPIVNDFISKILEEFDK